MKTIDKIEDKGQSNYDVKKLTLRVSTWKNIKSVLRAPYNGEQRDYYLVG